MSASDKRTSVVRRIGWVAVGTLMALALFPSTMLGAKPEYAISVDKTANPGAVATKGGNVEYKVAVENEGTGFFSVVILSDPDCSPWSAPTATGGDDDSKLEEGETFWYTCTTNVVPPHTNTVNVRACHDGSIDSCNNDTHASTASDSVTVTAATAAPTSGGAGATLPPTDSISGTSGTADSIGLVLLLLAGVLGSVMVLTPARIRRR